MDYDKLICQLLDFKVKIDDEKLTPLVCLDAANAIETLRADLARVTAERDAAVSDINAILSMDEMCPLQCQWCAWHDDCDGEKAPKWRGMKEG